MWTFFPQGFSLGRGAGIIFGASLAVGERCGSSLAECVDVELFCRDTGAETKEVKVYSFHLILILLLFLPVVMC